MNTARSTHFFVDMDSHVMEPPDLWDNYLEAKYRDRSIDIRRNEDGIEELVAADLPICIRLFVRFDRVVNLSATNW